MRTSIFIQLDRCHISIKAFDASRFPSLYVLDAILFLPPLIDSSAYDSNGNETNVFLGKSSWFQLENAVSLFPQIAPEPKETFIFILDVFATPHGKLRKSLGEPNQFS